MFAKLIHNANTTELSFHIETGLLFTSAISTFFEEGKGADSPTQPTITRTTFAQEAEKYLGHLIGAGAEFLTSLPYVLQLRGSSKTHRINHFEIPDSPLSHSFFAVSHLMSTNDFSLQNLTLFFRNNYYLSPSDSVRVSE